ncbi:MAG: LapA family protein [Candidatus Eiseniibacteriota bacterium]
MTNTSSTYLSILIGAVIGAVVSWWVYNRQKKTSDKQDDVLRRVKELEESHDKALKSIQEFESHHEKILANILNLENKIDTVIEAHK